jgi:5-formyltetrahydrofolate cyclo-ligase
MSADLQEQKKAIREQAHAARNALADKDGLSRIICERLVALPEYRAAKTVMYYVDVRSEVRTRHYLQTALGQGKRIVVPYCVLGDELETYLLSDMGQLAVGMYKILEPRQELRSAPEFKVPVEELDLIVVPGVAFDREGGRLGHGKGYYDKLLENARKQTPLVALAFECQLFPHVPMQEHDVYMDKVVTEKAVYTGKGRAGRGQPPG